MLVGGRVVALKHPVPAERLADEHGVPGAQGEVDVPVVDLVQVRGAHHDKPVGLKGGRDVGVGVRAGGKGVGDGGGGVEGLPEGEEVLLGGKDHDFVHGHGPAVGVGHRVKVLLDGPDDGIRGGREDAAVVIGAEPQKLVGVVQEGQAVPPANVGGVYGAEEGLVVQALEAELHCLGQPTHQGLVVADAVVQGKLPGVADPGPPGAPPVPEHLGTLAGEKRRGQVGVVHLGDGHQPRKVGHLEDATVKLPDTLGPELVGAGTDPGPVLLGLPENTPEGLLFCQS